MTISWSETPDLVNYGRPDSFTMVWPDVDDATDHGGDRWSSEIRLTGLYNADLNQWMLTLSAVRRRFNTSQTSPLGTCPLPPVIGWCGGLSGAATHALKVVRGQQSIEIRRELSALSQAGSATSVARTV